MDNETWTCDHMQNPHDRIVCKQQVKVRRLRKMLKLLVVLGVVTILFVALPYRFGMTVGDSMYPTMQPNHLFIMNIKPYTHAIPSRYDVVVFEHDGDIMVKRVIGAGADMIWLFKTPGNATIIPSHLVNAYKDMIAKRQLDAAVQPLVVPVGEVFVVGDNVENSEDSRDYGPVPVKEILGKVVYTENWKALDLIRKSKLSSKAMSSFGAYGLFNPFGVNPLGLRTTISIAK